MPSPPARAGAAWTVRADRVMTQLYHRSNYFEVLLRRPNRGLRADSLHAVTWLTFVVRPPSLRSPAAMLAPWWPGSCSSHP